MKHLYRDGAVWCDGVDDEEIEYATDDPREATCADCLKRAASYGAAAAMRYAAVEAVVKCPRCNPPLRSVP